MSGEQNILVRNQDISIERITAPTTFLVLGEYSNVYGHGEGELQGLPQEVPPFDENYFHLLVVPGKLEPLIRIIFPSKFVLNRHMRDIDERRFGALTEDAIDLLLRFPALVVSKRLRDCANIEEFAHLGRVLSIEKHDGYSSVCLYLSHELPISIVENNCSQFGIKCGPLRTELHESHWSVKNVCLANAIHRLNAEGLINPPINLMEMRD